jgi:hypothetical protein
MARFRGPFAFHRAAPKGVVADTSIRMPTIQLDLLGKPRIVVAERVPNSQTGQSDVGIWVDIVSA